MRYPSDLTDEEWALIGPLIPPAKRGGNKQTVAERDVVNGVQGPKFQQELLRARDQINLEIVKWSELHKFVVLPKRWIVERTIGWLNRRRRLAKGLGVPQPERPRFPALGVDPLDGQKALPENNMIPERLSGLSLPRMPGANLRFAWLSPDDRRAAFAASVRDNASCRRFWGLWTPVFRPRKRAELAFCVCF